MRPNESKSLTAKQVGDLFLVMTFLLILSFLAARDSYAAEPGEFEIWADEQITPTTDVTADNVFPVAHAAGASVRYQYIPTAAGGGVLHLIPKYTCDDAPASGPGSSGYPLVKVTSNTSVTHELTEGSSPLTGFLELDMPSGANTMTMFATTDVTCRIILYGSRKGHR